MPRTYAVNRWTLTIAFLQEMRLGTTESAMTVCAIDRDRSSGRASSLGHAIPSIFATAPARHRVALVPIDDEEPTMLLWGVR